MDKQQPHRSTFRKTPSHPSCVHSWTLRRVFLTRSMRLGRCAENLVIHYLKERGWTIRARNYETPKGEIDIIATRMNEDLRGYPTTVFIEVKSRSSSRGLAPELSVTQSKRQKFTATMRQWIGFHPREKAVYRCDIASLIIEKARPPRIQYFKSAFCAREPFGW